MTFIIGDIHGEVSKLSSLLKLIEGIDKNALHIFIGDYIDKGENPKECLKLLDKFSEENDCIFLIGNHEHIWINLKEDDKNANDYLSKYGGLRTVKSFNNDGIYATKELMQEHFSSFLNRLVPYWRNEKYLVTHSGIEPEYMNDKLEKIPIEKLLFNRYDFIKYEKYFQNNRKIIFGHTGFYTPYVDSYKIGIDTAACFLEDQPLTAFCLEEKFFIDSKGGVCQLESMKLDRCPNIVRVEPWRN